jgi:hypothetical protein
MGAAELLDDDEFDEAEAARRLGISKATLSRDRLAKKVFPIVYGKRTIRYNKAILEEYRALCRKGLDKSGSTGSANDPAPTAGAEPGSTPQLGKRDAHRLAQAILKRGSSRSGSGTPSTGG